MNIAVFFGGESCEHDISIITGEQLISKMNDYLYNIIPIYIDRNGLWWTGEGLKDLDYFSNKDLVKDKLKRCTLLFGDKDLYVLKGKKYIKLSSIDVAIVCMHGRRGEDGCLSGVLEMCKIPYTTSSLCASSLCMDKGVFKYCAKGLGVNVVDGFCVLKDEVVLNFDDVLARVKGKILFPVIIKPCRQGSSIGIEVCKSEDSFRQCLMNSLKYDDKVLIEKYVDVFKEVNVAVMYDKGEYVVSNTETPIKNDEILSFDDKYRKNPAGFDGIRRKIPADIPNSQAVEVVDLAVLVYKALDMFGIVRFDFIVSGLGEVYLNEVNTIPGSMANYLFDKTKYPYASLIEMMISNAIHRLERENKIIKSVETGVSLSGINGLKK